MGRDLLSNSANSKKENRIEIFSSNLLKPKIQ